MRTSHLNLIAAVFVTLLALRARADVPVQRTFTTLPSSNGHTAILADLESAKLTHFREHLFATEEPLLDANGDEVWNGNQPQVVRTRDLLYDAYFGLRSNGTQQWLTSAPVNLDQSGYVPGTGIVHWTQQVGDLELTTYAFAPRSLSRAGFVMAIRVRNTGATTATGVSVFSLHNFHLGFGRPGVMQDIGETGETVTVDTSNGRVDIVERAFAGVIAVRALEAPSRAAAWHLGSDASQNAFQIVQGGDPADLPDVVGPQQTADGWAHAFQFDFGDLQPAGEAWAGFIAAHHGDPFAANAVKAALDTYMAGRSAPALVAAEEQVWADLQARVQVPSGASDDEAALVRQSAVMLAMAQVRESTAFLREHLTVDNEPRYTRFTAPGGGPANLPGVVAHKGEGAILASLPPGEWTYAWIRDGAYAVAAMSALGLHDEARNGLQFYLAAEAGRFKDWSELMGYGMPPYQISLTRYHGFGVEETDFNDFGPNLEFDGFGLFLWSLRRYEKASGDTAFADSHWEVISTRVADPIVALVDPSSGLLRQDSSIWETHWNGRERSWTYTNLTAVRGLCDAAEMAERVGDTQRASQYRQTANGIRDAMARWLTDENGALASNLEERLRGTGYFDAAVVDAIAFGLFDPNGRIARATLDALDANLKVSAGPGWARNDDRTDHAGGDDLSPWGSEYDSAEWVITDLRGAVAARKMGRAARADELLAWTLAQSQANFLAVAETYEETTGVWKFNAPMIGFGAGAFALALEHRAMDVDGPACGAYYDEDASSDAGIPPMPPADAGAVSDGGTVEPPPAPGGCGCGATNAPFILLALIGLFFVLARLP